MFTQNRISISRGIIGKHTCFSIDGRALHGALGVKRDFSNWIKKRITDYQFIEGQDFQTNFSGNTTQTSEKSIEPAHATTYTIGLDMAKELCTLEKSERGRQLRRYIIESVNRLKEKENASRTSPSAESIRALSDALQNHMRKAGKTSRELGRKRNEYLRRVMDIQGIKNSPLLELFEQLERSNDMTFRALDDLAESVARNMETMRMLTDEIA